MERLLETRENHTFLKTDKSFGIVLLEGDLKHLRPVSDELNKYGHYNMTSISRKRNLNL